MPSGVNTETEASSSPIEPITEKATSRSIRAAPSTPIIPSASVSSAAGISQVSNRPCVIPSSGGKTSV